MFKLKDEEQYNVTSKKKRVTIKLSSQGRVATPNRRENREKSISRQTELDGLWAQGKRLLSGNRETHCPAEESREKRREITGKNRFVKKNPGAVFLGVIWRFWEPTIDMIDL